MCFLSSPDQPRDHPGTSRRLRGEIGAPHRHTLGGDNVILHRQHHLPLQELDTTRLTTEVAHHNATSPSPTAFPGVFFFAFYELILRVLRLQAHLQEHRPAALTPVLTYLRTYAAGRICEHLRELLASIAEFDAKFTHTGVFRHHWHLSLT